MSERAKYDPALYIPHVNVEESTIALLHQETSRKFHDLMDSSMLTSFHKYGAVADGYPEKVDALASLELRLKRYYETGNADYLVDIANFAMIEFMHPKHPEAHFRSAAASESPGRIAANKLIYDDAIPFRNTDLADRSETGF